jgi:nucleoside-diphosphate-sugar epimerase
MSGLLLTGGTGFIGRPALEVLARREPVDAITTGSPAPLPGVSWHRVDLADADAVAELLERLRPERLIHLAWYVEHGKFWEAPENVAWVERSLQLLRAFAAVGGSRAVMLGTCAEYDWTQPSEPLGEYASPIAPASLYGLAKDSLHRLGAAFAERAGVQLAWGRLFFLYGPREAPGRLVASVARALLAGEEAPTGSGRQVRDFMHVEDVAAAIVALLDSTVTGAVNIASGEPVALGEIITAVAAATGRPELLRLGALPDRPGEPPRLVADVTRLGTEVGFTPTIGLREGLAATVALLREER